MKINTYVLKPNVTIADLQALKVRDGGDWINKESRYFLSGNYSIKRNFEFSINIAFKENIQDWNDFDNILVLDEDFCQPYTAFYNHNYKKDVSNFEYLEYVIQKYNEYMDRFEIFEKRDDIDKTVFLTEAETKTAKEKL